MVILVSALLLLVLGHLLASPWQPLPILALLLASAVILALIPPGVLLARFVGILRELRGTGEADRRPRIGLHEATEELAALEAALDQMAEQLAEMQRELVSHTEEKLTLEQRLRESEKFAVIGRLSGGLAHELGSPLSVIAIRAKAIQHTPDTSPLMREHAEVIHAQVRRLSDFIQGLLHIAREQWIVFNPFDLAELLRELAEEIAPRARTERVWLDLQLPTEPVTVRGEKTLLRHALRNLVRNAFHALDDHVGERRICLRIDRDENEVRLLVEDSGPGIPSAHLDRVFEPFYTTKSIGKGMGLGLPITRGIIEQHGGELYLENLEHQGLRAVMVLPAAEGMSAAAEDGIRGMTCSPCESRDECAGLALHAAGETGRMAPDGTEIPGGLT